MVQLADASIDLREEILAMKKGHKEQLDAVRAVCSAIINHFGEDKLELRVKPNPETPGKGTVILERKSVIVLPPGVKG